MRFFLSYRRDDSLHESHALEKALLRLSTAEYPIEVFIDTEKIKVGQDFEKKMIKELENSDVVLAIIGHNWLNATTGNEGRARKIDRADDPVRMELEKALEKKIPLVVVLLDKAQKPHKMDLPSSLVSLVNAEQFKLDTDFDAFKNGVHGLTKYLQKFPSRRPNESLQKAQLCFFNKAPGFLQSESNINVLVNGKKIGEILVNKLTYKFSLEQGKYEVQLRRGLIYSSNKLMLNLLPGSTATISYVWNSFGGIEIMLSGQS
ncbi:MAG: TIR domain-containing protein [Chitinophagales bacterium]|nr:TIR domain-containing protein [Chitinophagales bacterium]